MYPDIRTSELAGLNSLEPAIEISEGQFPETESWWRRIARWSLYAIALTAPVLFFPSTIPPTFVKQVAVSILAFIAFISWLGESLLSGRVYYKRSLINAAVGVLLLVLFVSTLISAQALRGLIGSDDVGERFMSFLVFAVIFFVSGGVFYAEKESRKFMWWLLGGGAILAILSLLQFFLPQLVPFAALARVDVNPVGTSNAVAVLMGFYFLFSVGVLASGQGMLGNKWLRGGVTLVLLATLANLVVINFRYVWIAIAAGLIVLLGLQFRMASRSVAEWRGSSFLKKKGFGLLFLMLVITIFFILSNITLITNTSFIRATAIPAEVSPSYSATLDIARKTLQQHLLFGSGPATFGLDYSLFRSPQINQTTFWGVRFNSGTAFLPTALATMGVLGVLALLLFMAVVLFSLLRGVSRRADDDPVLSGSMAAVIFSLVMWWFYTTTFTSQVMLFAALGIMVSRMNETADTREGKSWWRISERAITFTTPWATFATSLVIIFLMVGGVAFLYYTIQQYVSAVYFARGVAAFNSGQNDIAGSLALMNQAVALNPDQDAYYRSLAQVSLAQVQAIINSASSGQNPNIQNDFTNAVAATIKYAEGATKINNQDALNWSSIGFVYQSLVPVLGGAENSALQGYDKAAQLDPVNPTYSFNKASIYLILADRAQLQIANQNPTAEAAAALTKQRAEALENARVELKKSVQLKPDYPQANYLMAQVLIRQGNLAGAIQSVETVQQLAPSDIGVAFQLGVLYYQAGDFEKAEAQFARAVSFNASYSNARYFLGLLYDRKAENAKSPDDKKAGKAQAIDQFTQVQKFNPDNQEVKTIIANLQANKPALFGISPPAPAPSQRTTPPVQDNGQSAGQRNP
ncbi:MAG: hypothetical protein A3C11_00760 [Candidatus Sungbacteria bacterium RIFCSPHIGHO2_02_FULL_49_12]|uniref:Uncharacterized protein n=1 Tax=Candidatus Sungbacteria bacterium RIFCSPHIGHO2_02_FULL_49_12 TaxID=1802271 RepID=A0A1G2KLG8_9BACT|nr:MAG: hypothetical protein A3C11_00760 [Candidatus Sungbacteria bacterium RIFCSPHIGHO2_02_FULL_49_12]